MAWIRTWSGLTVPVVQHRIWKKVAWIARYSSVGPDVTLHMDPAHVHAFQKALNSILIEERLPTGRR